MSHSKNVFTRQELYELVWSTPIVKLAEEFRLSDKGLAKICQRNQIPVPSRGYWARLEAGQKITKTPLRKMYSPELETVHFERLKQAVNPYVAFAIEATKSAQRALADEAKRAEVQPSKPVKSAPIAETRLHPSLQAFAAELKSVTSAADGTVELRWIKVHRDSIRRVIAFLNALANAFEPVGITFSGSESRVRFINDEAAVDFEITSPKKRVATDSGSWKSYENIYVGRLAFRIYGNAEGIGKNWVDTDNRNIENCIDTIVQNYRINLAVQKERDDRDRAEKRRRAHLAHRRDLVERRKQREENRLKFLTSIAQARREAHELKLTIATMPDTEMGQPDYDRMIAWAMQRLSTLEEQTTVGYIQDSLVEQNLFPETDDLFDPEGEPPPKRNYWDD